MAELTEEEKRTLAKLIKCSRDNTEFADMRDREYRKELMRR